MERLRSRAFLAALKEADVILGLDERTRNEFLVFGRSTLQGVVGSGRSMELVVLREEILQHTEELEALLAAVQVARGYHEYEATKSNS